MCLFVYSFCKWLIFNAKNKMDFLKLGDLEGISVNLVLHPNEQYFKSISNSCASIDLGQSFNPHSVFANRQFELRLVSMISKVIFFINLDVLPLQNGNELKCDNIFLIFRNLCWKLISHGWFQIVHF